MERLPTGIDGLNKIIQGGFIKNSVNLVVGGPGSGKTIFATQFLMEGLRNNEGCLYITFEEKKKKFYNDMLAFGWDLAKYEKLGRFVFIEYSPEQVRNLIVKGGGVIEDVIKDAKIRRIVIDSITSFSLLYDDRLSKKEAALDLFELLDKWECTSVMTSQDESFSDELIASSLEFEADGIILLYHIRKKGHRVRALEILKMRGTKHPSDIVKVEITPKGIVVDPKTVVVF
ncbi:hypothetical protein D6745_05610 [Candidatus Woesearchaeota archaeon]|nr:MAG: hypothetical protein D6745_05610 [Candidatus Woesearchaeota archaeon]